MERTILVFVLFASLLANPTQVPPPDAAKTSGFVERARVDLATFDVVVRDAKGRIVQGLGAGDFEVVEDGALLAIDSVDEWGRAPGPQPPREPPAVPKTDSTPPPAQPPESAAIAKPEARAERRSFVILFDTLNGTSALKLSLAKRAAGRFVDRSLREGDLAAVYQLDFSLRALTGFQGDASEIRRAVDRIAWMPQSSFGEEIANSVLSSTTTGALDWTESRIRQGALVEAQAIDWRREHMYSLLQGVSDVFEGLPGRRILVLVSPGIPMLSPTDPERVQGGATPKFREALRQLARSGVTVYSIDIGDDLSLGDASKVIDPRIAAGKMGLDESLLSDIGLDPSLSSGSAAARRTVLGVLAAETGGRLLTPSDPAVAFDVVAEESSKFYRIFCRVEGRPADRRYHRIVVRAKKPGLVVTGRRGRFGDVVPGGRRGPQEREVLDAVANYRSLALRGALATLPTVGEGTPRGVAVVVEVLGPVDLPAETDGTARLGVDFALVARAGDEVVARYSRRLDAKVRKEGSEAVREGFRLEGRLALRPGHYDVQAIVRIDKPAQYATWSSPLQVREAVPAVVSVDSLVVSAGGRASPLLLRAEADPSRADPLDLGSVGRILPATSPDLAASDGLLLLFSVSGPDTGGAAPKLDLAVRVVDADGKERQVPSQLLLFEPSGTGRHRGLVSVDTRALAPGAHVVRLTIRSKENPDAPPAEARAAFVVRQAETAADGTPPPTSSPSPSGSPASRPPTSP